MAKTKPGRTLLIFLAILGPGLITSIVDNDAGGITTYSVAGAELGFQLLWVFIPITIALVIIQEMCARMGVVTGKGLADLIRENFGLKITFFIMLGLFIANFATTVSEFAGIAAAGELFGVSKYFLVPLCAMVVGFLILKSNYKKLEKFFFLLVFIYISYIISGFAVKPDWGEVAKAAVTPSFSLDPIFLILFLGVVGTTITPWMQFYLQSSVVEKGVKVQEYKYTRWEVIIGSILTDAVSFFIIVVCGATLFTAGISITDASEAAIALEPFAGDFATTLFAVGLFGAAFFGAFIIPLATSFYICEAFGWESGVNKTFKEAKQFYIIVISLLTFASIAVLFPNAPLIKMMITSQVINGILLPFILIFIVLLVNKKSLMGQYTNGPVFNLIVWLTILSTIVITVLMVIATMFPQLFELLPV